MFPTYNSLAEVPEAFREHYVMKGGKAVAEVSSDHPLVVNNATLLNEKTAAEARAAKAEGDLESAKASSLPRNHVAVPKADAELLEKVKAEGVTTPEAFTTLKTEHADYKQKAETAESARHAAEVGELMGWDKEKTARLATKVFDFSALEVREKDGKKEVVAKVKSGEALVERPFSEVVKATPELTDLLPALKGAEGGKAYVRQDAGGPAPAQSVYDQHVKDVEAKYGKGDGKPRQTWQQSLGVAP